MIFPKATAKLKIRPWVQNNSKRTNFLLIEIDTYQLNFVFAVNAVLYLAREGPLVFFSAVITAAICKFDSMYLNNISLIWYLCFYLGIPTAAYLISKINAEPKGIAHQKVYYSGLYQIETFTKHLILNQHYL